VLAVNSIYNLRSVLRSSGKLYSFSYVISALASSFRSALDLQICSSGRNFHFSRGPISQQTLCCVGSTQFQPQPKQLYKSLGLSSGAALVGFAFGVTELISIYLHFCAMCSVSVSFFPQSVQRAKCDYPFSTPSDGRQAVRFAAHSSSSGVCTTEARVNGVRRRSAGSAISFAAHGSARRPHNRHA